MGDRLRLEILNKQAAGIPLSGDEARTMVRDLRQCIREGGADTSVCVLLLAAVGSRYYDEIYDELLEGIPYGQASNIDRRR